MEESCPISKSNYIMIFSALNAQKTNLSTITINYCSLSLIIELDPLLALDIDVTTFVATSLLLILLLCETLALRNNQILVSLLSVVIWDICVTSKTFVNLDIFGDPGKWNIELLLGLDDWIWG